MSDDDAKFFVIGVLVTVALICLGAYMGAVTIDLTRIPN